MDEKRCNIRKCNKKYYAKNFCAAHYMQIRRNNQITFEKISKGNKKKRETPQLCKIKNCFGEVKGKSFCGKHYVRLLKYGSPYIKFGIRGKSNPNWQGGTSEYPNHHEMKKNRLLKLSEAEFRCEMCYKKKALEVHHKDGSKTNHEIKNLLAVCRKCHMKLDQRMAGRPKKYGEGLVELSKKFGVSTGTVKRFLTNKKKLSKRIKKIIESRLIQN